MFISEAQYIKLKRFILGIVAIALIVLAWPSCHGPNHESIAVEKFYWKNYRGFNVSCNIKEADVAALAASGANLMRLSMPVCAFMDLEEPYTYRPEAFAILDSVLNWGEKYQVNVLIDPHRYPGTMHQWTMLGTDPFWQDFKYHDILLNFWDTLAAYNAHRGEVIAGYDLLNEPEMKLDAPKASPADINYLYQRLTDTIRKRDSVHTIVYALPRFYIEEEKKMYAYHKSIPYFQLPDDDNICIETHMYLPVPFTHQNIWEEGEFVSYPSKIEGEYWDKQRLEIDQKELIDFAASNPAIPIFVGEFSSPRWTGQDGVRYMTDVIELNEANGWSWVYHAFRENQVWDPEMSIEYREDSTRIDPAPRMELLKAYFKRNK
ncbi:glycoside hydrolase family 5 protein [Reichenbachiella carrageenanivorans]|uniref:Glycoside hydrolase family 5 protein n=1 Tax=Reichenbachiella carrageenanivorans TaxID=2979869 RepID=A0ABY6D5F4_9BACT|nr:glycoside hydrolase family 5 protein [Reichenbachiella carrageenanivorans]UXX81049.1 glycoside hydrolase family 5 protein [Reichenbachiella carrageenanivorans]